MTDFSRGAMSMLFLVWKKTAVLDTMWGYEGRWGYWSDKRRHEKWCLFILRVLSFFYLFFFKLISPTGWDELQARSSGVMSRKMTWHVILFLIVKWREGDEIKMRLRKWTCLFWKKMSHFRDMKRRGK